MNLTFIALLVFLAVYLFFKSFAKSEKDNSQIVERVRKYATDHEAEEIAEEKEKRRKRTALSFLSAILCVFMPKVIITNMEAELIQADIPIKAEELLGLNMAGAAGLSVLSYMLLQNFLLSMILAIAGAYAPLIYIRTAKARRLQQFNNQLGDALSIMANSLRAGFSFLQTMESLSREMAPPISKEFTRALREMRLGTPTEDALRNLADRIKSEDMELIVTAVTIQRQVGGNLAQILDNIGFTISERVRIKGEIKTLTAQGRISGMIISLLPLFLAAFISMANPSYMAVLLRHPLGWVLIGGGVVSEVIGIMAIKKIVNVEV